MLCPVTIFHKLDLYGTFAQVLLRIWFERTNHIANWLSFGQRENYVLEEQIFTRSLRESCFDGIWNKKIRLVIPNLQLEGKCQRCNLIVRNLIGKYLTKYFSLLDVDFVPYYYVYIRIQEGIICVFKLFLFIELKFWIYWFLISCHTNLSRFELALVKKCATAGI